MRKTKSKYEIFKQRAHIIIYGTSTKAGRYFDLILLG
ncbi:MAG: voltage-gated potassium channel, partial [Flavobacterium sp.]